MNSSDGAADFDSGAWTGLSGHGDDAASAPGCTATYSGEGSFDPVQLAFAFDVSASMGKLDKPYNDPTLKWQPVVAATTAFFEDPASTGISASLRFFPIDAAESTRCDPASYATPNVPMTPLPSGAFRAAIDAVTPKTSADWISGTPTLAVVKATIGFIQPLAASDPRSKCAIVLVTDGYPQGCKDNDVSAVADAVRAVASTIPTYVIGVLNPPGGPDTVSNLNGVAEAGGTDHAFIIATGDPEGTKSDFEKAVTGIHTQTIACDFAIPPLPDGRTFDPNAANVAYTVGTTRSELAYDATCSSAAAWHYDVPSAPTRIVLCESTCNAIKSTAGAVLHVDFGCARRQAVH